jgi:ATP-dependent helicase/nuclease subunit B
MPSTLPDLLALLDAGTPLLLPNARSARELRSTFDAHQRAHGLAAWEPAAALSWSQWTTGLWSELIVSGAETRLLLNAAQEHSLWLEVIAEDKANSTLASADSLAELAQSAWQLAAAYNATANLRTSATTNDSRIFAAWAETFSQRCTTRSYLSSALLDHAISLHLQNGNIPTQTALHLVDFSDLKLSQQLILEALRRCNTEVVQHDLIAAPSTEAFHASVITPTEREELTLAAQFLLNLLHNQPSARIAVLLPDLAADRSELEDILRETLAPELQSIRADLSATPWDISGGAPLSSLTLIADALDLTRWSERSLPLPRVSSLLLSPYLGELADRDPSAVFDANTLRQAKLLRPEIDIASLLQLAKRAEARQRQPLLSWLRNTHSFLQREDLKKPRTFADWMAFVRNLTSAANWPGSRALTATEFAATVAWDSVLDLVSTLDFNGRRVSFSTALEALERQAQTTVFTPPSTNAQVQVMSVAEAEGSLFDAVLFLRATDANWPPAARTNPLLAWQLQRDRNMPGTDPILTNQRAQDFTNALLQRTPTVLFTSAASNADGHLRPTPLLTNLNRINGTEVLAIADIEHSQSPAPAKIRYPEASASGLTDEQEKGASAPGFAFQQIAYDLVPDDTPIPPLPTSDVHGGAALLKLQAACGFLAFAQLRLNASEPDDSGLGLDAAEGGSLLHAVLQQFWTAITTRDELAALSKEERSELLHYSIDKALADESLHPLSGWDNAYLALLRERLHRLLLPWLEEELKRSPFTVVATEHKETIDVGPLTLTVRIDRIDQVANGTVLVDYKTGAVANANQWKGDRPNEPQLPLYTFLLEPDELQAIAFARLRAGDEMKYAGLQTEKGIFSNTRARDVEDLTVRQEEWRNVLTALAEDFAAGRADVRPKSYAINCAHCAQRLLCRLDPATLTPASESEEVDDV